MLLAICSTATTGPAPLFVPLVLGRHAASLVLISAQASEHLRYNSLYYWCIPYVSCPTRAIV
jgi:hypothetical protein